MGLPSASERPPTLVSQSLGTGEAWRGVSGKHLQSWGLVCQEWVWRRGKVYTPPLALLGVRPLWDRISGPFGRFTHRHAYVTIEADA